MSLRVVEGGTIRLMVAISVVSWNFVTGSGVVNKPINGIDFGGHPGFHYD